MISRRAHRPARRATHDGVGTLEMLARALNDRRAGLAERGMRQDLARLARRDPGLIERFTRQIQAADLRVLVEVAHQCVAEARVRDGGRDRGRPWGRGRRPGPTRRPTDALATRSQ